MGRKKAGDTKRRIVAAARELAVAGGLPAVTLDAVAEGVSLTKQAVLYHFGSKTGLLLALFGDVLEEESAALSGAVAGAGSAREAVDAFVKAAVAFYLDDLPRFRLLYVAIQAHPPEEAMEESDLKDHVYPLTSRIYDALEAAIAADPSVSKDVDPRRAAVGIHFAALGVVTYVGMLEAVGDRLKHDPRVLAAELARTLGRGLVAAEAALGPAPLG